MHGFPNQMRYQAALLPDGGFPRGKPPGPQVSFGTKRNRGAHCGTITSQNPPHTNRAATVVRHRAALTTMRKDRTMGKDFYDSQSESLKSDYLYFVHDPVSKAIKIGRTNNPHLRLQGIQNGNPNQLDLLDTVSNAGWQEAFWHEAFGWAKRRGEWFDAAPSLFDAIKALRAGEDWTDHIPPEIAPCDEIPPVLEWQAHTRDALIHYREMILAFGSINPKTAAFDAIFDPDFDGRPISEQMGEVAA